MLLWVYTIQPPPTRDGRSDLYGVKSGILICASVICSRSQDSVMQRAKVGMEEEETISFMYGIFHLASLLAAGDRLWAFISRRRDATEDSLLAAEEGLRTFGSGG